MSTRLELRNWVASGAAARAEFRQAVHIVLDAVALEPQLGNQMLLKGGMLLAVRYQGNRYTKDVDFSTTQPFTTFELQRWLSLLEMALNRAADNLDYEVDCRPQRHEVRPPSSEKTYQTLHVAIGYARRGTSAHKRLLQRQCSTVVKLDYSFNETTTATERLQLDVGTIQAYALCDLVAEKLRAMLQQPSRNRTRRQDAYDLHQLIARMPAELGQQRAAILDALVAKARARDLEPERHSLQSDAVRQRSAVDYQSLAAEVDGDLPPFDEVFTAVVDLYASLPWDR